MKPTTAKFQIGKNGFNPGTLESLNLALKNHKQVRISTLKSFCRNKTELNNLAEEILENIDSKCSARIIGYTIILIKEKNSKLHKQKKK